MGDDRPGVDSSGRDDAADEGDAAEETETAGEDAEGRDGVGGEDAVNEECDCVGVSESGDGEASICSSEADFVGTEAVSGPCTAVAVEEESTDEIICTEDCSVLS